MQKISKSNHFILHPKFKEKVQAISRDVDLPKLSVTTNITKDDTIRRELGKLTLVEDFGVNNLDALEGTKLFSKSNIFGYDESIEIFKALEGSAYLTCHSLILIADEDYLASTCLSFNFYTRSELLINKNAAISDARKAEGYTSEFMDENSQIESAFKADYAKDRNKFILKNIPDNSILFIDGPLIGKQMSKYATDLNKELLKRSIIPIFVVKNSSSNLVTDNIKDLAGKYNSDMHWAHQYLKPNQRTCFFRYTDQDNSTNSKIFCYMKPFKVSPQRIEIHPSTYYGREDFIVQLLNLVQYLYIIQGDIKNPQMRPIAIAEKFARENKKIYNMNTILADSKIQATMNQARGF